MISNGTIPRSGSTIAQRQVRVQAMQTSPTSTQHEGHCGKGYLQIVRQPSLQAQEKEVYSSKQKALEGQIGKIMQELKVEVTKLQQQTSELTGEIKAITVDTIPVKPGAYHLNYFEWVISMLRDLRKRVNESRMWLQVWAKKKQQKGYWAMFKKHGTSFAMSDERAIASANG